MRKLFTLFLLITLVACDIASERQKYGDNIIERVENFRSLNGRLPKYVSEIGLYDKEDSQAFYKQTSDSTYIVWYGLSLGESKTYHSETKEWKVAG